MARSKKEIAKELMYKKILPTSTQTEAAERKAASSEGQSALHHLPKAAAEPKPPAAEPAPQSEQEEKPVGAQLVNLMEGFVESRIDEAMKKFNCCTCEKCRKDVLAITLNKLQPYYVIEEDLNLRDQKEKERAAEVAAALVKAILAVKAHPNH